MARDQVDDQIRSLSDCQPEAPEAPGFCEPSVVLVLQSEMHKGVVKKLGTPETLGCYLLVALLELSKRRVVMHRVVCHGDSCWREREREIRQPSVMKHVRETDAWEIRVRL